MSNRHTLRDVIHTCQRYGDAVSQPSAALIAAGRVSDPRAAAAQAAEAIDSGAARDLLQRLAARSHELA